MRVWAKSDAATLRIGLGVFGLLSKRAACEATFGDVCLVLDIGLLVSSSLTSIYLVRYILSSIIRACNTRSDMLLLGCYWGGMPWQEFQLR